MPIAWHSDVRRMLLLMRSRTEAARALAYVAAALDISRYAVPDQVVFVDTLDRTSVGKIDKKALRRIRFRLRVVGGVSAGSGWSADAG